jgi:hypothetical protein
MSDLESEPCPICLRPRCASQLPSGACPIGEVAPAFKHLVPMMDKLRRERDVLQAECDKLHSEGNREDAERAKAGGTSSRARARAVLVAIAESSDPAITTTQDRIDACRVLLGSE